MVTQFPLQPLLITQGKLGGSPAPAKKRPLEDVDNSPPVASEDHQKKQRPTLLDTKRIKKPSRYESTKSEDDNEVDSEDSELDEGEEEEEESLDGEEESLDSAAADEDENEQKFNEEDEEDDDDDEDDEVGEAIEEPTLIVRGHGDGHECQALPDDALFLGAFADKEADLDPCVGETIVEELFFVHGSGTGAECLVGNNSNNETNDEEATSKPEPKATFFFGEPGCLKLSPIKQTPKQETKRSIFDSIGDQEPEPEKTNGESRKSNETTDNDNEKVAAVLNGNESPDQKQEDNQEQQENCNPSRESDKIIAEDDAKEKMVNRESSENLVENVSEKTEETKEISIEQNEERPEKSEEESVEQVYKVRVIETTNESVEIVKNTIKTEATNEKDELETRKHVDSVAEKREDNNKLNMNHVGKEELNEEIIEEAAPVAADTNAAPKPTEENSKSIPNEETEPQKTLAVEAAGNGVETTDIDKATATAGTVAANVLAAPAAENSNKTKLTETVQSELPSTSKVVIPNDNQNTMPKENKSEATICEAKEPKESKIESQTRKAMLLPNRKRRLADFAAPAARHSTSESEIDIHGELQLEDEQQLDDDDLDIGGKRIKMRPKITNVEVRRKVEAQKTQIEETTSSSGEEDARSRRKIIAPKRHLEKPNPVKQKPTLAEIIEKKLKKTPEKPKDEQEQTAQLVEQPIAPPVAMPAPTQVPAQPVGEITPPIAQRIEPVPFTPPKKSPITKPLKKNLLTQIRQEESDEEATPRKRTNSETVVTAIPAPTSQGFESTLQRKRRSSEESKDSKEASVSEELPAISEKHMRNNDQQFLQEEPSTVAPESHQVKQETTVIREAIPEQEWPQQSAKTTVVKQASPPVVRQASPPVVKQASPPVVKPAVSHLVKQATPPPDKQGTSPPFKQGTATPAKETTPPPVKRATSSPAKTATSPPAKRSTSPSAKRATSPMVKRATSPLAKRSTSPSVKRSTSPPAKQATPPPSATKKEAQAVKQATPSTPKEDSPPPPPAETQGRRSGRRGGTAVVYSELPQPKRTRGGPKEKSSTESKQHIKEDPLKIEDEELEEKPAIKPLKSTAKTKSPIKEEPKQEPAAKEKPKSEPVAKQEPKSEEEIKVEEESKEPTEKPKTSEPKEELPKPVTTPGVGRGRGPRKKREVDTTNIIDTNDSETPVRQSRRIAQQKIKEEAERRKLEEVALRTMKQQLKNKKKAEKEADPTVLEPSAESESFESASEAEETKKKIKKKCPGKNGGWSSDSEEQAESEEEEEEPPHYDTDPGSPLFRSDHEFSPESEVEDDSQVVPMKRARTLRKENADDNEEYAAAAEADEACQKCGKSDHPEWILLCDTPDCNKGYHCSCLSPVLFYIPEGDWHCPPCQQEQLIAALEQQLQQFDDLVARKHQEKLLAEEAEVIFSYYIGFFAINMSEICDSPESSEIFH